MCVCVDEQGGSLKSASPRSKPAECVRFYLLARFHWEGGRGRSRGAGRCSVAQPQHGSTRVESIGAELHTSRLLPCPESALSHYHM